jgi:hypothetical protein
MIGAGTRLAPARLSEAPRQSFELSLPAGASRLTIGTEPEARAIPAVVALRPLDLNRGARGLASAAATWRGSTVWFLDDQVFVEPGGFWVRGTREARLQVEPAAGSAGVLALRLRNGGAANDVRLSAGAWRLDVRLAPGEEQAVDVPLEPAGRAWLAIQSRAGFRPSETGGSADTRFLGVWVELR